MKARLYMKSGNQVTITHVKDVTIKYSGNTITGFEVEWEKKAPKTGVMIGSIALDQIEAIELI